MKTPETNNKTLYSRKITWARLGILFFFFFFLSCGGYWLGANTNIILPIFNCEYVGGSTTRGLCIALLDFSKYINNEGFLMWMGVCVLLMFLFGRLWCGYVCPFGLAQDIITLVRQKLRITQINLSQKVKPLITVARWSIVFYIFFNDLCKVCPIQYFTLPMTGYYRTVSGWAFTWSVVLLAISFFSDRAFCRVCPLGALMGLFNRVSGSRLKKCGHACTHCRACLEVCPVDLQEVYEDRENEDISHPDCIYCMKCIEVCPEKDALWFTLFGKTILKSKRTTR